MRIQSSGWDGMEARIWARRLVQRKDWLALDLETTGLEESAEVVEIGAVGPQGETILDLLVRPSRPLVPLSMRIHGLTAATLEQAPRFENIYPIVSRALVTRSVVSYNSEFDRRILDCACQTAGYDPFSCEWHCALAWYEKWRGFRPRLSIACEIEGIGAQQEHRALPDAFLVWQLVRKMAGIESETPY